jgi:predicted Zn-dependent protease
MIPVHEQWQAFPSIPLPQSPYQIILPANPSQRAMLQKDAADLSATIYEKTVNTVQAGLPASGKQRLAQLNRMGILHARFGLADKASAVFQQAMKEDKTHLAAYLNLGSLYLREGKSAEAVTVLRQAKTVRPESSAVQLMLAQAYYALGDTAKTQEAYLALQAESKELAAQYSWLSQNASDATRKAGVERAGDAASPIKPIWSDGE